MLPFRKILCPTDFSSHSYKALDAAKEVAEKFGSELIVTHIVHPLPANYFPTPATPAAPSSFNINMYDEEATDVSKRRLEDIVEARIPDSIKTKSILRKGHASSEIVNIAEEEGVDLIVISTHGHSGWQHLLFGSVAEKVVRLSPCPVLTIHIREEDEEIEEEEEE